MVPVVRSRRAPIPRLSTSGAALVGGHFAPALLGSAVGAGLGLITLAAVGDDRSGLASFLSFSFHSLLHAGSTTLFERLLR